MSNEIDEEKIKQLEKERDELIKQAVGVHRKRLEGLQWQCDRIIERYGDNHVGAAVELSKLMMESLSKLHSILTADDPEAVLGIENKTAQLLSFSRKSGNKDDSEPTLQ